MRSPLQWLIEKSIPVIARLNETQWLFQGTSRSTLTQILSRVTVKDPYSVHPWVRGAIESVALNIAGCPVVWKNSRGDKLDPKRTENSRWVDLFEHPNEQMGLQQLWEATVVYLLHYGECMWVLDRTTPTAVPTEIYPYNGQMFEHVLNKEETKLLSWKVSVKDGKDLTFLPSEVVFIKLFNPYDRWRGLAPLAAAQIGIDQDYLASQYNKAFFANSAMPGGVIEIEEEMTEESFTRMREQFQQAHQGVSKAHMLAILEGGAKYKQLVPSQKDMEFLNQKKWNRDEILACFKVPKLELGIWDDVNFAVAKVQAREFWVKTLIPKMKLIEYALWAQLFSKSSTGNVYVEFDTSKIEALQGDMLEKVDMARKLWEMGVPFAELNKRFGFNFDTESPNWKATYIASTVQQVGPDGAIVIPKDPNAKPAMPKKDKGVDHE